MQLDEVCYEEKLGFVKYLNEKWLLYCITSLSFAAVFSLLWIMSKFTFFEKAKLHRGSTPKFPYGNLGNVVNYETTVYELLWKYHNRFKKKGYDMAGLFFFIKPVIVLVNRQKIKNFLRDSKYSDPVFPCHSHKHCDESDIFALSSTDNFLDNYHESLKGTLPERLKKDDWNSVLRNHLLESLSLAFGLNSFEIVDEINELIKFKTESNFRHTMSLSYPRFRNRNASLYKTLDSVFLNIAQNRKKNDVTGDDYVQYFIDLFNKSQLELNVVSKEFFDLFCDIIVHSYSVILACLYELSRNQQIQEELAGEIRRFNKEYGVVDKESLEELVYLNAVVRETLRKYPPIPYLLRSSQQEIKQLDTVLPKGTLFAVSILGLHRDPENYTNPEYFDPERFLDQPDSSVYNFMPFGCTYETNLSRLVILNVKLILIGILSTMKIGKKKDSTQILKYDAKVIPMRVCESYPLVLKALQ